MKKVHIYIILLVLTLLSLVLTIVDKQPKYLGAFVTISILYLVIFDRKDNKHD